VLEDVDLQDVAGPGAADEHRAGHEVRPRPRRHLVDRPQVQQVHPRRIGMELRPIAGHPGRERHGVARVDFDNRRKGGVEIAPDHVSGVAGISWWRLMVTGSLGFSTWRRIGCGPQD
jgi:hypothetical protein